MSQVIDLTLNASIDGAGQLQEITNDRALKEALNFFLSVKRGDVLGYPEEGGVLDTATFSVMSIDYLQLISFKIRNAIIKEFEPEIILNELNVIPDYDKRILIIEIFYTNPLTDVPDSLVIYTEDPQETVKHSIYVDILYTGENLYNFCFANQDKFPEEKLIFNADLSTFFWGQYKFVNLTKDDPYFDQILLLLND
jgi:hypothetical protein